MRIRFGTRGFLLMIAVILIGSSVGYRYYYQNYKVLGTFTSSGTAGKFDVDQTIEFQSDSLSFAELTIIEDHGKSSERRHPFRLMANKKYKFKLDREDFYVHELDSKLDCKPLWIFPGFEHDGSDWVVPSQGLVFSGKQRSWGFARFDFQALDGRFAPHQADLVISINE